MDSSIMHHVALVLLLLWLLNHFNRCYSFVYFASLVYLFLVHERCVMRLRMKLRFEEWKQSCQRKVLCDSESVRWLNYAVEKIWPICMEQIASQKIMLPIIPWFLEKYKPWTARKAVVQHLYLGRSPPFFTEMRVLRNTSDDDHLVLELGMNFLTADDMIAILGVKLRKRLGFGMWAKLHMTGMHVEGKLLIGVKFVRQWPFLGRVRVCFAEPPYFQMTVKPIFTHGLDVTVLPGIAGWLDKLLSIAFEQTLVEPNMLVVDVEKFASPGQENWFSIDEKEPIAFVRVEVVEASDMKPSDMNGLADPYVKGQLGPYRFRTKIQKKTLSPNWQEEFKMPICTWESPNILSVKVCDKDHFVDDSLGECSVNVNDLRDGQRHDMWLSLQNIKMGRLHLAITVLEANNKESIEGDSEAVPNPFASENAKDILSSLDTDKIKTPTVPDHFEPINIEGQEGTGIWIHQPGSEVSQCWKPRKGKARSMETMVQSVPNSSFGSTKSTVSGNSLSSSDDENPQKKSVNRVRRGLRKIGSVFHKSPRGEQSGSLGVEAVRSPYANIKSSNERVVGVKFVFEDNLSGVPSAKVSGSPPGSGSDSPRRNVKNMAKSIIKHAERSAHGLKHVLTRKGSRNAKAEGSGSGPRNSDEESESCDDDEPISSPKVEGVVSVDPDPMPLSSPKMEMISEDSNLRATNALGGAVNSDNAVEHHGVETSSNNQIHQAHEGEAPVDLEKLEVERSSSPKGGRANHTS